MCGHGSVRNKGVRLRKQRHFNNEFLRFKKYKVNVRHQVGKD